MIGFAFTIPLIFLYYCHFRTKAKSAEVVNGSVLIRVKWNRQAQLLTYFGIFITGLSASLMTEAFGGYVYSFLIGIITCYVALIPPTGFLLETEFGRVYVLTR